ncbi:interferon-induced protein 44 isoform X1 [Balaenoptera acutorostrata]|uniref:Interferon-induced protein 44 n=1 Tax=Balaenoptera acutorostrata TaxID=9767 RepID=A0A384AWS4_BALAC|nr:interferon-induced protein 44 isoform X1 [Balaenoptera acutorostrata]
MAMTTCLTWMQEKKLQNHFGEKQFSLLYKASVHEFSSESLLQRCSKQGPIITVIHSEDHILGAYVPKSYPEYCFIILFAFQETTISQCKIGPFQLSMLFCESDRNSEFNINLEKKEVAISINTMGKLGLPQCDISFQECEVFRCEDLLDKRRMDGLTELRESLLTAIRTYEPYGGRVRQVRILLLGPIGAGKSSFFNSVKSVFRGHVTNQALVGSKTTGESEKYRTYFIKDGKDGNTLPFILCDSMGLSEKEEGLHMDDIPYILEGCIPDRYQFNSMKPFTPGLGNYTGCPMLKDRIHCVAFVFDANSVGHLSDEMVEKIRRIRRELIKCGVVHVVLLTHVDTLDLITKGDLIDIYRCVPVKVKLEAVHRELGFALSDIFVVSNYTSQWELEPVMDVLNLSALRQMLWAADDFLEDLPLEETSRCF